VLVPGDYDEARRATFAAAKYRGPVYLRLGRDSYPVIPELHGDFVIGRAKALRDGRDITLVSTGIMAFEALRAADELAERGLSARVLHFPTVKPLDLPPLLAAARETRGFVTAEEHSIIGGLGEAVASALAEAGAPAIVRRVGMKDTFGESGPAAELLDKYGLRARDIVREALAVLALRSSICYPKVNVKVVGAHGGITTGGDGASHQACEDIAIARAMPNLTVLVPGDYDEARRATFAAAKHRGPVYLRLGRDSYPVIPELHGDFVIGRAKTLRDGRDITLVSTGIMAFEALRAADELAERGLSARALHFPTIKPLDLPPLLAAARETRGFVTAEEHSIIGGLGEAVASALAEAGAPAIVRRVGMKDTFGESGTAAELLDKYGLRARDIVREALAVLALRSSPVVA
jgi:transketolase